MKDKSPMVADELTLDQIMQRYSTDETARAYLEAIRWPNGIVCPHCKSADASRIWKIKPDEKRKIRAGLYSCGECKKQFTCTVGTIFEDSHIPLRKWLVAWHLISSSKKGISSLQIQRILGLGSYRTALFMMHRIRHTLKEPLWTSNLAARWKLTKLTLAGKHAAKAVTSWATKFQSFRLSSAAGVSARK